MRETCTVYSILAKFPTSVDPPERLGLSGEKEASRLSLSNGQRKKVGAGRSTNAFFLALS